ncbi:DUF1654 domain-containing protein [Pseudomonas sp. NFACC10-1]|uniref:DUF1654 domain-containing protein n=1 Tax=Pseudomonas sp. NFACC10-1 TaxID=1566247 RepID=UPI000931305C|nr:DUF1654 domain-containing protein [Pseudomonas sp. NFACC10-1]
MERLSLRVSSMINHPIAQQRRTVRIHRLDTDGEREWQEMLGALAEAGGVALKHHEQDASITLRWGPSADDERQTLVVDQLNSEEAAPF